MTNEINQPRIETTEVDGHVITHGCRYLPDSKRWVPIVSVRPSWNSAVVTTIDVKTDQYQDTPQDASDVALNLANAWLAENKPKI